MGLTMSLSAILLLAVMCGIFVRYMQHIPGALWGLSGFSVMLLMLILNGSGSFLAAAFSSLLKGAGLYGWLIFVSVLVCAEDGLRVFFCRALGRKTQASMNDVALAFGFGFATAESIIFYYAIYASDMAMLMGGVKGIAGLNFSVIIALGMVVIGVVRIAAHYMLCRFETLAFEKRFILILPLIVLHTAMNFSGVIASMHFSGSVLSLLLMLPTSALVVVLMYFYGKKVVLPFKSSARICPI